MESLRWIFRKLMSLPRRFFRWFGGLLLALMLVYYPLGMLVTHRINDDPDFSAGSYDIEGGSHTVAMAQALIQREVKKHHWVPNDPFFYPTALLIRMPAFQRGILSSLSRFGVELSDQLGRARGSSQIDSDLEKTVGLLKYSPNVWVFDFSTSLLPTTPSEDQYLRALKLLGAYNARVAEGKAVFDRRADNLMETLERIGTDMGSSSAAIEARIHDKSQRFIDTDSGQEFYFIKGRMYADYLLLRELKRDFASVIQEKQLGKAWDNLLDSLYKGAQLGHLITLNGSPTSAFTPNHFSMQGFYLLRARTQLREVTNILLK